MTNEANLSIQTLNSVDINIFYWFYGITPQAFGAIIAAIGMVAVYKLSDQREKTRNYIKTFIGLLQNSGFIRAGEYNMTIEQAIIQCDDLLRQYNNRSPDYDKFVEHKRKFVILLNERNLIIWRFIVPMILCFVMITIPMIFLTLKIFNWVAIFSLLVGVIITIVITFTGLILILLTDKTLI